MTISGEQLMTIFLPPMLPRRPHGSPYNMAYADFLDYYKFTVEKTLWWKLQNVSNNNKDLFLFCILMFYNKSLDVVKLTNMR